MGRWGMGSKNFNLIKSGLRQKTLELVVIHEFTTMKNQGFKMVLCKSYSSTY
ncbi:MAG: hypothetical protein F6K36_03340 [Symploca sp. SIO3C6]|nr:hypothetical protein [Symploca sp. SIO3C6]